MKLIAIKSFTYKTRRLLAGDEFETRSRVEGKVWIGAKKAREMREPGKVLPPPASMVARIVPAKPVDDEIVATRAEYQATVGKRPYMGWGADTVRAKMAEALASIIAEREPAADADVVEVDEDAAS